MDEKGIGEGEDLDNLRMVNWRGTGKISSSIEMANKQPLERYKENVKGNYTKSKNEKSGKKLFNSASKRRWRAGIGAVIVLAGLIAGAKAINKSTEDSEPTPPGYSDRQDDENTSNSNITLENEINTIAQVKQDFMNIYLEAYNEKYGTNYASGKMIVNSLKDGVVLEMADGKHVTRGEKPDETKDFLKKFGGSVNVEGYDKVLQIQTISGEILGTYNIETGEFIYSGNDKKLKEKLEDSNFIEPTLEYLGINPDKAQNAAKVIMADEVESSDSIKARIATYQNTPNVPKTPKTVEDNDYTR